MNEGHIAFRPGRDDHSAGMRFWVVKGRPSRNDLDAMLAPGKVERWRTKKPPRDWGPGDRVFFWKGAPALRLVGVGQIETVQSRDPRGTAYFDLKYLTSPLTAPVAISELRRDAIVGQASFLKAGAAGTLFLLTPRQAARLLRMLSRRNNDVRMLGWDGASPAGDAEPRARALSVRQPWAELILRGIKTIEVRSARTHVRGRVHIYASLGDVSIDRQKRIRRKHGIEAESLPRGVLVGSVEIVDCRPLRLSDSCEAGFPVPRDTNEYAWLLARPRRAIRLRKPTRHPQPVFFYPF